MTVETFLSIAGFALSLGALLSGLVLKDRMREITVIVVMAALVATTGIALLRHRQQEQLVARVEREILSELSADALSFQELYQGLHFRPFAIVNEALFRAVEKGAVGHRVVELKAEEAMLDVRLYYVKSRPGPP